MTPIHFPGEDIVLAAPANWDASRHGTCSGLPVMRDDGVCVSKWRASWSERLRLLLGKPVLLRVRSGQTQPPVAIEVES